MVSPLYESEAVAPAPAGRFLNAVARGRTRLAADELLAVAKALERRAGRRRAARGAPRPLDLDLLLYGDQVSRRPELTLPHPGLAHRRFALAPLALLAPARRLPGGPHSMAALLRALPERPEVRRLGWKQAFPEGVTLVRR